MRTVQCTTPDCPRHGTVRTVPDRHAAPGVVYRPDLFCADCGTTLTTPSSGPAGREKAVRRPSESRSKATTKRKT